ncbi:hypothetical protein LOAG_00170 [Loa loa]|uniref:Uncharacterized protein n=1 Tax=Loa loa TaxID=7209 RepID=A0A1S0UBT4_LOALO|nr:hypothetical protein LOAG_00170 [Loa loa]EFO28313.1 hypothetical protein LOAG_00170 [Loa loa]
MICIQAMLETINILTVTIFTDFLIQRRFPFLIIMSVTPDTVERLPTEMISHIVNSLRVVMSRISCIFNFKLTIRLFNKDDNSLNLPISSTNPTQSQLANIVVNILQQFFGSY